MALNVLVVDDSAVIRAMVIKTLRLSGLSLNAVHEAGNGKEALQVLDEQWGDLALVDINMPVMNGEEFLARVRDSCLPAARQYDAAGEIANVICGNVVPRMVNPRDLFQLGVPESMTPALPVTRDGERVVAEVHLGLDNGRVELQLVTDAAYEGTVGENGV